MSHHALTAARLSAVFKNHRLFGYSNDPPLTLVASQIVVSRAPLRAPPSFPKRALGTIETSQYTLSMGNITVLNEV